MSSSDQEFVVSSSPSTKNTSTTRDCGGGDPYAVGDGGPPLVRQQGPLVTKDSNSSNQTSIRDNDCDDDVVVLEDLKDHSGGIINAGPTSDHGSPWPLHSSPHASKKRDGAREGAGDSLHPSPASGWPQRSPMKSDHHHHHEEASFTLFTQSFDTLSETGHYLNDMEDSRDRSTPRKASGGGPPRRIDLTQNGNDVGISVGDISPIKLDDPVRRDIEHHHRGSRMQDHHGNHHHRRRHSKPVLDFVPAPNYGLYQERRGESAFGRYEQNDTTSGRRSPYFGSFPASNPFYVLRCTYKAFSGCTYLLPCLKDRIICPVNLGRYGNIQNYSEEARVPDEAEIKISTRRVEAAICAFGGYIKSNEQEPCRQATSIFRLRNGGRSKSPTKEFYDSRFHRRYFVNGTHVSWDIEENPPVATHKQSRGHTQLASKQTTPGRGSPNSRQNDEQSTRQGARQDQGDGQDSSESVVTTENQQKMKYRCKLCGQLKQNHNCPYQQSLQRSIAVMVHPAVNAFTASEPGILTKSLSEMNNFVSYDSDNTKPSSMNHTHDSAKEDPNRSFKKVTHVTPETAKTRLLHSPESSLSTHSPDRSLPQAATPKAYLPSKGRETRKRSFANIDQGYNADANNRTKKPSSPPFAATLNLRPEHYRAVTPRTITSSEEDSSSTLNSSNHGGGDYCYPPVPLTFVERKRLSDTLFFLSQEIPNVTRDVSALLRHAREVDEWDLAVAELLTQIVVSIYCSDSDSTLEGLHKYLLGVGVSC